MPAGDFDWTDTAIATLRRVAREGGSLSDAGRALGVTRNACAGKAHREGIHFACAEDRSRRNISRAMLASWNHPNPDLRHSRAAHA